MSRLIFEDHAGDQFWIENKDGKLTLFVREEMGPTKVIVEGDDILALANFVLSEIQERLMDDEE